MQHKHYECMCVCQILDLLIEVFNKGGDAKLDVAINCNHVPELTRLSPYVAICFTVMIVVNAGLLKKIFRSQLCYDFLPSVLWHFSLGIRMSIRPVRIEWWEVGVGICLEWGADCLHMVQLMPLHPKTPSSLASFKSRLVLPFWYWLTQVVLEKRSLNGCSSNSSSSYECVRAENVREFYSCWEMSQFIHYSVLAAGNGYTRNAVV